jgi:hypothetical protein
MKDNTSSLTLNLASFAKLVCNGVPGAALGGSPDKTQKAFYHA